MLCPFPVISTSRSPAALLVDLRIALERQIDAQIYELYGLTEEEIGIMQKAGKWLIRLSRVDPFHEPGWPYRLWQNQ
jgi:hypothetical protein